MLRRVIQPFVSSCQKEMMANQRREECVEDSVCVHSRTGSIGTLRNGVFQMEEQCKQFVGEQGAVELDGCERHGGEW